MSLSLAQEAALLYTGAQMLDCLLAGTIGRSADTSPNAGDSCLIERKQPPGRGNIGMYDLNSPFM